MDHGNRPVGSDGYASALQPLTVRRAIESRADRALRADAIEAAAVSSDEGVVRSRRVHE
jgi:hypothetical protein